MDITNVIVILELIGIIAFSVSGAMVAIDEELDIFGVVFVGITTALGGGIMRDVLLGNLPPAMFTNYRCIVASIVTSLIVFVIAAVMKEYYFNNAATIEMVTNIFDAIGLGVFSVMGMQVAQESAFGDNRFLLLCLGMITGVGGGMMRDMVVGRKPMIFSKHIYAIASIIGCFAYLIADACGLVQTWNTALCIGIIFLIRMLSTHYRWNLPKIRKG